MRRALLTTLAVLGVAACEPVPTEVSTGDAQSYAQWEAQREAELTGRPIDDPGAPLGIIPLEPPAVDVGLLPIEDGPTEASQGALAAAQAANATPAAQDPGAPLGIQTAQATGAAPQDTSVSNENDFDAVANRRTIEDDAERLRRLGEEYQQVQPTDLPDRPDGVSPNIVAYALSTTHPVGMQIYARPFASERRYKRNCSNYLSTDQAQKDFLSRGGPERDRLGIDPDGDGFACRWDPTPFRLVQQTAGDP